MRLKLVKNQVNDKQHPEAKPLLFENYSHCSFKLFIQKQWEIFKKISKRTSGSVYVRLIIMKMNMKMENR